MRISEWEFEEVVVGRTYAFAGQPTKPKPPFRSNKITSSEPEERKVL